MGVTELFGFFLPPIIDFFNKNVQDARWRYLIALAISIIVGTIINLPRINFATPQDFFASIAIIATEAQAAYKLYWENSQLRERFLGK